MSAISTTAYLFVHNKKASKEFDNVTKVTAAGAALIHGIGLGYRVHVEGQNVGRERRFIDALRRARELLPKLPTGTTVTIEAVTKDGVETDQVRFRKVEHLPREKDTRGSEGLDRVEGFIEQFFHQARFAGDCVCKPNSDHAFCAAVDYFDTTERMEEMRDLLLSNAEYFDIKYVILFDRIWFVRDDGSVYSEHYGLIYHNHIHISVNTRGESAC